MDWIILIAALIAGALADRLCGWRRPKWMLVRADFWVPVVIFGLTYWARPGDWPTGLAAAGTFALWRAPPWDIDLGKTKDELSAVYVDHVTEAVFAFARHMLVLPGLLVLAWTTTFGLGHGVLYSVLFAAFATFLAYMNQREADAGHGFNEEAECIRGLALGYIWFVFCWGFS